MDARADEFFAVFGDAGRAVAAAVAIQRSLAEGEGRSGADVRVRVGLPAHRRRDPHRHQVRRHRGAHGVALFGLGEYSLPSITEPMALYQVRAEGLRATFPRLRA